MARVEYNWNVEYKKDKRLKEMKDACHQIFMRLKEVEASYEKAAPPVKTETISEKMPVTVDLESSASNTDSDGRITFVNPMDEMSEYENESDRPGGSHVAVESSDQEEPNDTPCFVCGIDDDDDESMICELCNNVCHTYCAGYFDVPESDYYCAPCIKKRYAAILDTFIAEDVSKLHEWILHAGTCPVYTSDPSLPCSDAHCTFMKSFLRCMSWLLFNQELRGTPLADKLARLLGYHAARCTETTYCSVPLCNDANRRKTVKPHIKPIDLDK
ncbi:hypothetical protein Ae201684P_008410 [Aphanomyces euteiches]|nr:hypothetical protein Ae201684P_008410 [Aphanomyces euteiches]